MSVGAQASSGIVDQKLTNLSVGIRELMFGVNELSTWVVAQGNGSQTQGLINLGYSTVPSASNPSGLSDAATASLMLGYLTTLSGVYSGTVQQGGTGGTNATTFNFNNALGFLWAGQ